MVGFMSTASSILSEIQVKDRTIIAVRPRPGWAHYFEELLRGVAFLERETRVSRAVSAPLCTVTRAKFDRPPN